MHCFEYFCLGHGVVYNTVMQNIGKVLESGAFLCEEIAII